MNELSIAQKGLTLVIALFLIFSSFSIIISLIKKIKIEVSKYVVWVVLFSSFYVCLYFGGIVLAIFLSLLIIQGGREIYYVATVSEPETSDFLLQHTGITLGGIVPFVFLYFNDFTLHYLMLSIVLLFLIPIFESNYDKAMDKIMRGVICLLIAVLFSYIILIRSTPYGFGAGFFLLFLSDGTSTVSYIFGRLFGRTKIALLTHISPKKTLEGLLLGIVMIVILSPLLMFSLPQFNIIMVMIGALIVSIFAQLGDLSFSIFKRIAGIKDYSHVLLEEGGILDEFDCMLLTMPTFYCYLYVLYLFIK